MNQAILDQDLSPGPMRSVVRRRDDGFVVEFMPDFDWYTPLKVFGEAFVCGYCGCKTAAMRGMVAGKTNVGYGGATPYPTGEHVMRAAYICENCLAVS